MSNDSRIAGKIKTQITCFVHKISDGFKKPTKKFVVHTVYGIQASKDVKLSNISRNLNEQTPLIKTEARLSRNNRWSLRPYAFPPLDIGFSANTPHKLVQGELVETLAINRTVIVRRSMFSLAHEGALLDILLPPESHELDQKHLILHRPPQHHLGEYLQKKP